MEDARLSPAGPQPLGTASLPASPPVVDLHCHTAGTGAGGSGCFVSDRLRRNWRYRVFLRAFGVTERLLAEEGDGAILRRLSERLAGSKEVTAAVILALDGAADDRGELDRQRTELYVPNEFVAAGVRPYPNLLFGASINPLRRNAMEQLEAAAEGGAALVKWLPPVQHFHPADRRFVPFYERLAALGLPLLCHTGDEQAFTRMNPRLGDPASLRLPLEVGVTVIAAHAGASAGTRGLPDLAALAPLLDAFPNLYADVSALTQANRRKALPALLASPGTADRLVYGTDMPLLDTVIVSPWIFFPRLGLRRTRELNRIENPWDRDVALKRALGVPDEVFRRGAGLLRPSRAAP